MNTTTTMRAGRITAARHVRDARTWRRIRFWTVLPLWFAAVWLASIAAGQRAPAAETGAEPAAAPRAAPAPSPVDFFPLAVGNRWQYRATYRLTSHISFDATATLVVEGVERIQGREYFKAVCKMTGLLKNPTTTTYYRRGAEGIWQADINQGVLSESLLLPVPLRNGVKWTTVVRDEVFFGRVTSRQEARLGLSVQSGGTVYPQCAQVTSEIDAKVGKVHQEQWLAPGVGVVKQSQQGPFWSMDSILTAFRGAGPPPTTRAVPNETRP